MFLGRGVTTGILALALLEASTSPPFTQQTLQEMLRTKKISPRQLVHSVRDRGVDFQLTQEIELELRKAGASADLLLAIQQNYRGTSILPKTLASSSSLTPWKPLTQAEVVTLLQVDTPKERILELARRRGLAFRITPDVAEELKRVGADAKFLSALAQFAPTGTPNVNASKGRVFQRAFQDPAGQLGPSGEKIHLIWVEPAANGFDQLVRAEIQRQMPWLTLVDSRQHAEVILTQAAILVDASRSKILWSNSGVLSSDPQEAARQLVSRLKQAHPNW
ncbi:MAG: hypothetical protein NZV14_20055 [Bryobacteraceae bacterium]|nr:hypothetical protein [Bryobacteraceae bacterium]MDW8380460.1 hypothetical protein [Bryobacterales bacterium]